MEKEIKKDNKDNTYNTLFHWHSLKLKLVFEGICVGIITGLLMVLYRYSLEKAGTLLEYIYNNISKSPWLIIPWILILIIIGYIVGAMVKHDYIISGSGIIGRRSFA